MNLNQVTIPSINVKKAIQFYKKLGLQLIVEALPNYARFVCPIGNSTFSVHKVDYLSEKSNIVVYFECENLDAKIDVLLAEGIIIEEMPQDKPWLWREARLKDIDGNQVVLYFAGENRVNPPWKIKI